MARILIRNDDREILFFTLKSSFSDIDPRVVSDQREVSRATPRS